MTQYQITVDQDILHQLFIGTDRDAGVARLLETVLNQVLTAQATDQLAAQTYERTSERKGYRNGSYERDVITRAGSVTLRVPRFRDGSFSTELFARYQRSEQALVLSLMEMVINGVSTRKVTKITEELCGTEFSKSTVSHLCKQLDPAVHDWNNRSLADHAFPFITIDAIYVKVREEGRICSRGVLVGYGVNEQGRREILGLRVDDTESEESWGAYFRWLKERGLHGVELVTSDYHGGLVKAIEKEFQGVSWQRCQTHFIKNVLNAAPKALQSEIKSRVRSIFDAPDMKTARSYLEQTLEAYAETAPKAMKILEDGFEDAVAVLAFPEAYRVRLRTSNGMERLNGEIRRRETVIRIFPNRASVIRLIGAMLMEENEYWMTKKPYMDMTDFKAWKKQKATQGAGSEEQETSTTMTEATDSL
ncbi:DNA polymerase IV [Paenibacillus pasadenensis]|uniref:Mutator family transposase n=9 Tax=Paenibacillus pasadenensis TaxID=217090 RepID=A0A2N5N648_9BACL|nr:MULTISPECIES: IS256 family transposase [Paenibacillus]PLT43688.1 DNA polymerase IV [Paenibacillus pasadenensis]PLT44016.1 DNA polymerase IV [Paenibacillus pasadenensis]PLT44829.1 DNA polymerase IV [Paenibacillus pasadenensis]PLT45791.1 DNA polymerase IV [Paenibacillus pasadenensis]PLT45792.1 DNA polymerase IV [Paenibacillus pasadenensis]